VASGSLLLGTVGAAVLDEADALLSPDFYADTAWLLQQLPQRKQVRTRARLCCVPHACGCVLCCGAGWGVGGLGTRRLPTLTAAPAPAASRCVSPHARACAVAHHQVLAFSATYTPELLADLESLMRRPQKV
jgi:superfamily II DNA/RNA helicase